MGMFDELLKPFAGFKVTFSQMFKRRVTKDYPSARLAYESLKRLYASHTGGEVHHRFGAFERSRHGVGVADVAEDLR